MKLLVFSNTQTCGPCRMMAPVVEAVMKDRDIEMVKDLAHSDYDKFGVTGIPTYILVDDENNEVRRLTGAVPKPRFEKFLEE